MTNAVREWNGPLYDKDCDPRHQEKVQKRLDRWYTKDRRYDPAHPFHASYTGLAEKYGDTDGGLDEDN